MREFGQVVDHLHRQFQRFRKKLRSAASSTEWAAVDRVDLFAAEQSCVAVGL
jgi:hypothetical protein